MGQSQYQQLRLFVGRHLQLWRGRTTQRFWKILVVVSGGFQGGGQTPEGTPARSLGNWFHLLGNLPELSLFRRQIPGRI